MGKRILNFTHKDFTNALRDNIVIYIVLFPVLLALGMKFFLLSVQNMTLTVAVDSSVEQRVVENFKDYANVEIYDTHDEVRERVEKPDDMAGIVKDGNEYVIILEGNEAGESEELMSALVDMTLIEEPNAQFEHVSLGRDNSILVEVFASLLLLVAILIGGMINGFNIVNEREGKTVRALAVSPLKMSEFVASHALVSIISGIVLGIISTLILVGTSADYGKIIIATLCSAGIGIILGFLIGGFADNLISAIAVMKVVFLFFTGVPLGSVFVPQNFQWVFYIFPHYWSFQAYRSIYAQEEYWLDFNTSCIIALCSSLVFILPLVSMLKKRLKLR